MSAGRSELLRLDSEELGRLMRLTAPERAQIYGLAGLDLGERSMIEAEVRARIAGAFRSTTTETKRKGRSS